MFSSVKLATVTLFATVFAVVAVSASPLIIERAPTCKPNFEGNRQTIYHVSPNPAVTVNEWTASPLTGGPITLNERERAPAFARGEFLVQASGSPTGSYQFKYALPFLSNSSSLSNNFSFTDWRTTRPVNGS
jgi:hypothetical protein